MSGAAVSSLSQFLNHGALGLLAILCIVVLGHNAWSLNRLIQTAQPAKVAAARPLLLTQSAVSVIGLLAVGAGAIYVQWMQGEEGRIRTAQILIDPWDETDAANLPEIQLAGKLTTDRPITVTCTPGSPATVRVKLERFLEYRTTKAIQARRELPALAFSSR